MTKKITIQPKKSILLWFDSDSKRQNRNLSNSDEKGIDHLRILPFYLLHLGCFAALWVGFSPTAGIVAISLYALRMFAITGFYHRYFSHRSFETNRFWQFVMAVIGCCAIQRGPLWWAAHHRFHHHHSDKEKDPHSPRHQGFWYSHVSWFLQTKNFNTRSGLVKDWGKYPELVWLDRFDVVVPILFGFFVYLVGMAIENFLPSLETTAGQVFTWGFVISTVVLYHATFSINSLAHRWGTRPYTTKDDSRNNFLLAILTFGEGWHNNHHHYPIAARQGFNWWQIDLTYYGLWILCKMGIIKNLNPVPKKVTQSNVKNASMIPNMQTEAI